jgi:hypothetical protein
VCRHCGPTSELSGIQQTDKERTTQGGLLGGDPVFLVSRVLDLTAQHGLGLERGGERLVHAECLGHVARADDCCAPPGQSAELDRGRRHGLDCW